MDSMLISYAKTLCDMTVQKRFGTYNSFMMKLCQKRFDFMMKSLVTFLYHDSIPFLVNDYYLVFNVDLTRDLGLKQLFSLVLVKLQQTYASKK